MNAVAPHLSDKVIVIGAGIGGLSAALRLASAGRDVLVVEAAATPGGKMRTLPSIAGPVEAGPTVLTMRDVFEDLFAAAGETLADHVTTLPLPVLARHFWRDGSTLDLFADHERSAKAVRDFAGADGEAGFRRFSARAAALWRAFERPVMRAARPGLAGILGALIADPSIWRDLGRGATLARAAADCFKDRRLAQLFGRYATYVGGTPEQSPAVLALIWQAEAQGVWAIRGGMSALALAIAKLAQARGAQFLYRTRAERIVVSGGRVAGVALSDGTVRPAAVVVFNGDAAALGAGLLDGSARTALPRRATHPRSHSAWVWAFAGRVSGPDLAYHNVFFAADPDREFTPLSQGRMQTDPTLYICAQDRVGHGPGRGYGTDAAQGGQGTVTERFEIIMNAAPTKIPAIAPTPDEARSCRTTTFTTLERFGTRFDPPPPTTALTGPGQFARLFPGSEGSLYGLSPHGPGAAFRRPSAATRIPGLWIAGGGVHPGAGVPMAALSGMLAAQSILTLAPGRRAPYARPLSGPPTSGQTTLGQTPFGQPSPAQTGPAQPALDQPPLTRSSQRPTAPPVSTFPSRPPAMPGGTSTASRTTDPARSR